MTERFTHKEDDWEILDNGEHLAYAHSDYQAEKICELLNEQHETIERLKQNIDELMQLDVEEYLLKENKELKQSNERLLKMLDNVANYMQKENKYMPIDDFVEWWNKIATKGLDGGDFE